MRGSVSSVTLVSIQHSNRTAYLSLWTTNTRATRFIREVCPTQHRTRTLRRLRVRVCVPDLLESTPYRIFHSSVCYGDASEFEREATAPPCRRPRRRRRRAKVDPIEFSTS